MERLISDRTFFGSIVLALGVAVGGGTIGYGLFKARSSDRYVTVKGVSERDVKADLALWPLHVVATGDDLSLVQARVAQNVQQVRGFLRRQRVDTAETDVQGPEVNDTRANPYGGQR